MATPVEEFPSGNGSCVNPNRMSVDGLKVDGDCVPPSGQPPRSLQGQVPVLSVGAEQMRSQIFTGLDKPRENLFVLAFVHTRRQGLVAKGSLHSGSRTKG